MEPSLITLYAGGNDILDFGTDVESLMKDYAGLVAALAGTGATVVLFTGFDIKVSALLEPLKKRNALYNQRVREVAASYGAVLVHDWVLPLFGRKLRGVALGDQLRPRWPEPVRIPRRGGLKKLLPD